MTVKDSYDVLVTEESDNLIEQEKVVKEAVTNVENNGIVFIDEFDKICGRSEGKNPDVSREGVQRDLLPLIEGTTVATKHGMVKTDHILFIASGAFHVSKPSDLLPELQGRLPIRVELKPLTKEDFYKILCEPEANLILQYKELLKTENFTLEFEDEAIREIAALAAEVNENVENIGARVCIRFWKNFWKIFLFLLLKDRAKRKLLLRKKFWKKSERWQKHLICRNLFYNFLNKVRMFLFFCIRNPPD